MRCVEQPQLLKLMVDVAADHMTQNFMKGKEEVLKDFKVTDLKCKGGTPYPMSVKEGTIKKDPSKKARDLPAPDGGVVTPAELRQMKKDARKVPARRGWLAVCDCLSLPGGLDRGMAYGVRRASGKKVTYFFFLLQAYESPNSRGQSQTYV